MTMPTRNTRAAALTVYTQLLEAWNRCDADAFAALFTANGSSVGFDGSLTAVLRSGKLVDTG